MKNNDDNKTIDFSSPSSLMGVEENEIWREFHALCDVGRKERIRKLCAITDKAEGKGSSLALKEALGTGNFLAPWIR